MELFVFLCLPGDVSKVNRALGFSRVERLWATPGVLSWPMNFCAEKVGFHVGASA